MHDMHERWNRLWAAAGATGSPDPVFADLVSAYTQADRAYHNAAHISFCLDELDRAEFLAEHPHEIELALWFHDAVYDTHRQDNESQSAALAGKVIADSKLKHIRAAAVNDLILATRHDASPATNDARLIVDIDLAILGQKKSVFDAYEDAIRKEFAWVPEEVFRTERSKVMRHFLDKPHLYHTAMFRGRYESAARVNVERSLARWK